MSDKKETTTKDEKIQELVDSGTPLGEARLIVAIESGEIDGDIEPPLDKTGQEQ